MAGLLLPMFSRMLGERTKGEGRPRHSGAGGARHALGADRHVGRGGVRRCARQGHHGPALFGAYGAFAPVFALLIGCFVAVCTTYVFGTLLTAGGNLRQLNWMAAGGALLNIGLNLVLIPRAQAEGAAWASLVTQVLTAVVQLVLAAMLFKCSAALGPVGQSAGLCWPFWWPWIRAWAFSLGLVPQLLPLRRSDGSAGVGHGHDRAQVLVLRWRFGHLEA